jgi:hypothetical protein
MTAIMTFQINIWPRHRVLSFFLSHDFDCESKIANKKIQEWFTYFFFQISNRSINQFQFKLAHFAL